MPINRHGAVWYFILATIVGICTLLQFWRNNKSDALDTHFFRRGFLVQLLSYGAFSYFMGRSHDNNLLNIMPFVLLVLLHAISTTNGIVLPKISTVLTAGFLSWLPLFGWQAWSENIVATRVFTFEPKLLVDSISFSNHETVSKIDRFVGSGVEAGFAGDAGLAIDFLHQNFNEPVTVLNFGMLLVHSMTPVVWSAIPNLANYGYIPAQRRREFLNRTASSLGRSGWLVIDRKFPAEEWLADFDSVYNRTNRIEFGTYYAIRFSPKTAN
jgi:hypothetical protein